MTKQTLNAPLLRAENLSWGPPNQDDLVFANVALRVDAGEKIILVGPSGSGKSTLLRCLMGLEPRRGARVWWRGNRVDASSMRVFRQRAAFVQQHPTAVADTVGENMDFARQMARELDAPERALDADAQRALFEQLGLAHIDNARRFDALSVGEQQRVCLVRALIGQPDLLLLDEPTSALDPERVEQVEKLLLDYVDAAPGQRALIWISHHPAQIERVGTRVLNMAPWDATAKMTSL
ncbi:ABC transporter ATP-binding protein [Bradymonas sediminis]|nr:ABC transporter ATP-binding protein [Bradymonas sediminis]TDP75479.1 putative ABC transport system ATP-binding protein [Bradymonas sediminis]